MGVFGNFSILRVANLSRGRIVRRQQPAFRPAVERPTSVSRNFGQKKPADCGRVESNSFTGVGGDKSIMLRRAIFRQSSLVMGCITGANDQWRHKEPFCVVVAHSWRGHACG